MLRRAMNVRPVSQCRLLAAEVAWSKPAECHLVALWKLRQNDFSTSYHANIKIRLRLSFALLQVIEGGLEKEGANMFTVNMLFSF